MSSRNEHTSPEVLIVASKVMRGDYVAPEDLKKLAASAMTQARDRDDAPKGKGKPQPQPQVVYQPIPWSTALSTAVVGRPYPVWIEQTQEIAIARRAASGEWVVEQSDSASSMSPTHFYPYPVPPGAE